MFPSPAGPARRTLNDAGTKGTEAVPDPRAAGASIIEIFRSLQGEGLRAGEEHIFVRFGGCNLACDYCDTPESIPPGAGSRANLEGVLGRVEVLQAGGAPLPVALTGGEPLMQAAFLVPLIRRLRARGHRIYLETNGTLSSALAQVVDGCDWIAMDFKPRSAVNRDCMEAHQWFLKTGGPKIFVKMVLTDHTLDAEVRRAVDLISGVRRETPLVLQPATPWGKAGSAPLMRVAAWWEMAAARLPNVCLIPQMHPLLRIC